MEPADASLEQDIGAYVPMSDAKLDAIGTLLAIVGRVLKYQRHWLSVAQFLIVGSLALAFMMIEIIRAGQERAITLIRVVAIWFEMLHRHLSRPPSRWASA